MFTEYSQSSTKKNPILEKLTLPAIVYEPLLCLVIKMQIQYFQQFQSLILHLLSLPEKLSLL